MASGSPSEVAGLVAGLVAARPATLGTGWLICIDGPGGSGKSVLAAALAEVMPGSQVVHMDDLYDGWTGMRHAADQLGTLLLPLARGEPGSYRRYDWHQGEFAETVQVPTGPLLVLEGVASGTAAYAHLVTLLVWVVAPAQLRLARGLERDGDELREQWVRWMADEDALFAAEQTAERADVLVDGTGAAAPRVRG